MKKKENSKSALSVSKGVEQPSSVNKESIGSFKTKRRKRLDPGKYMDGILGGNVTILSQAITLVESSLPQHRETAAQLVEQCLPLSGNSSRIGITGVPGVGKSTFIENFGRMFTKNGSKLAVLAVDPSSELSRGSILGDKTRMESLSSDSSAFIRPSPSGGSLGGVARKTRENIILCEAAGFDTIIVETVGVGQSETAVKHMVDFFLLLMLAGAGDELQGIKRGIMEMADAIAITKADGANAEIADYARIQYQNALTLFPPAQSGWAPRVWTCSSVTKAGFQVIYDTIEDYFKFTDSSGYLAKNRVNQSLYWMNESIEQQLKERFYGNPQIANDLEKFRLEVAEGKISSYIAARKLILKYSKSSTKHP